MKSTRFWIILLLTLVAASAVSAFVLWGSAGDDLTANIYQNGELIQSIDLSEVGDAYTVIVSGSYENTVLIEQGRICVSRASCPDNTCVHQGWISSGAFPIVCLPNKLIIKIEGPPGDDFDAIAR